MKAQADMNTVVDVIRQAPDSSAASQQLQSALDLSPDQVRLLKSGDLIWWPSWPPRMTAACQCQPSQLCVDMLPEQGSSNWPCCRVVCFLSTGEI